MLLSFNGDAKMHLNKVEKDDGNLYDIVGASFS